MMFRTMGAVGALLASAIATSAQAEAWDLIVTNSTGKPIKTFSIGPSPSTPSTLGPTQPATTLNNGARTTIHFDRPSGSNRMDLVATFSDGTTAFFSAINVVDYSYVTLKFTNGKPTYAVN